MRLFACFVPLLGLLLIQDSWAKPSPFSAPGPDLSDPLFSGNKVKSIPSADILTSGTNLRLGPIGWSTGSSKASASGADRASVSSNAGGNDGSSANANAYADPPANAGAQGHGALSGAYNYGRIDTNGPNGIYTTNPGSYGQPYLSNYYPQRQQHDTYVPVLPPYSGNGHVYGDNGGVYFPSGPYPYKYQRPVINNYQPPYPQYVRNSR